ncbi:histidine kinase [Micromonospora sp. KC207]|nr:histidine kinase [Micromonospora sp. KC207]
MLAIVALSYQQLSWWALAGALLAPVTAVAVLTAYPLVSLGVCVAASMATALAMGDGVPVWSAALSAAVFLASFLAGRRMLRPAPAVVAFAAGAVLAVPLGLTLGDVWATALLLLGGAVVLPWMLGRSVQQQSDLVAIAAERARLRERNLIAHDMHDTLGHELGLLALRAGALELAADLDHRHRAAAADLRASAGLATERLADIVTVLRDGDPVPLRPASDRIEDVVDRAVRAGMAISLEWNGPRRLPTMVDRAAHRIVQEALTNAMKHATGAQVRVHLATRDATTTVTVTNPMPSPARRATGARSGLVGLRERVRLVGGTLHAGPHGHVFQLVATLPHPEAS